MKKALVFTLFVTMILLPGFLFAEQITGNMQATPCPEHAGTKITNNNKQAVPCPKHLESVAVKAPDPTWEIFNKLKLESTDGLKSYQTKWQFGIAETGDLLVSIDEQSGNDKRIGEIMLVSGLALLTKGLNLKEGTEIDALDGPVLMCKLAISLLHYAIPDGPKSIDKHTAFTLEEKVKPIVVSTLNSASLFPPPWKLKGTVDKVGEVNAFALSFSFKPDPAVSESSEIKFQGAWENSKTALQLADSMSLKGWKVYLLGSNGQIKDGDGIADNGARAERLSYITLGDLRKSFALTKQD